MIRRVNLAIGTMYIFDAVINSYLATTHLELYRSWKDSALLPVYRNLINSVSDQTLWTMLIGVALYQIVTAIMLNFGTKWNQAGCVLAMIFHALIIPWGLWSLPNILFLGLFGYLMIRLQKLGEEGLYN